MVGLRIGTLGAGEPGGPVNGRDERTARLLEALATAVAAAVAVAHARHADAERLALIVNSSPDAIVTTDEQGTVTGWNAGAEDLYGYGANETIGQPAALVLSRLVPADHHDDISLPTRILNGEDVRNHVTARVRRDGTRATISLCANRVHDLYGRTVGLIAVIRETPNGAAPTVARPGAAAVPWPPAPR